MNELISVIVPVYNVEKYLPKCIDSILNQTYKNLEVLLVDDGSTDESGRICDEYAQKDSRIRVIHKENGGLSDARNCGLDHSAGEFISFIDSDDYIATDMIECLVKQLQHDQSDMVICNYLCVDEDGCCLDDAGTPIIQNEILTRNEALSRLVGPSSWHYVTAVNKLYRRKLFENMRFQCGKIHEDEFIVHHLMDQCEYVSCISASLYFYVQRAGSITHTKNLVKRSDCVEAFLDRTSFVLERGLYDTASQLLYYVVIFLGEVYSGCKQDEKLKHRFMELKAAYDQAYKQVTTVCSTFKYRLVFLLFHISPKMYTAYSKWRSGGR